MAKSGSKSAAKKGGAPKKYVVVSNSSYGRALKGQRIYYEGKKPTRLADDGRITFGKNILEILRKRFGSKFRWVITEKTDSIEEKYGIANVRTSQQMLNRMFSENFERSREVKIEIVQRRFFAAFPTYFTTAPRGGGRVFRPRRDETPAHQRQFADRLLRMLADHGDRLGWGDIVVR